MELPNSKNMFIIFSILIFFNFILSIKIYFKLRNKRGPRGPRGERGPRGPRGILR